MFTLELNIDFIKPLILLHFIFQIHYIYYDFSKWQSLKAISNLRLRLITEDIDLYAGLTARRALRYASGKE